MVTSEPHTCPWWQQSARRHDMALASLRDVTIHLSVGDSGDLAVW